MEPEAAPGAPAGQEPAPAPAPASQANPVPAGMTEEEYMRIKMEELKKRFS